MIITATKLMRQLKGRPLASISSAAEPSGARQLGRHFALGAAQHERRYATAQLRQPLAVAEFFNWGTKQLLESGLAGQASGLAASTCPACWSAW